MKQVIQCPNPSCKGGRIAGTMIAGRVIWFPCDTCDGMGEIEVSPTAPKPEDPKDGNKLKNLLTPTLGDGKIRVSPPEG